MDLRKFQLFSSGLSEEERAAIEVEKTVKEQFQEKLDKVRDTIRSEGWAIIIDKIVSEIEVLKSRLIDCKSSDLLILQEKIRLRKEFLDEWTQYIE